MALAFLTKGPAIFPVAAGLVVFRWLQRRKFPLHPSLPEGMVLFLLLGLSWYFLVVIKISGSFSLLLQEQVIGRLFSPVYHRNSSWYAPFYLYLPILTLGGLPWALIWVKAFKELGPGGLRKVLSGRHFSLLGLWFLVPLVVFSLAKSRLPLYILPLFAPLSLMTCGLFLKMGYFRGPLRISPRLAVWLFVLLALKFTAAKIPFPQDAWVYSQALGPYLKSSSCHLALEGIYLDGLSFYTGINFDYLPDSIATKTAQTEVSWRQKIKEIRTQGRCLLVVRGGSWFSVIPWLRRQGLKVHEFIRCEKIRLYELLP
ncbi:hypothetical protein [Thermosulfuriphilus sp.]